MCVFSPYRNGGRSFVRSPSPPPAAPKNCVSLRNGCCVIVCAGSEWIPMLFEYASEHWGVVVVSSTEDVSVGNNECGTPPCPSV